MQNKGTEKSVAFLIFGAVFRSLVAGLIIAGTLDASVLVRAAAFVGMLYVLPPVQPTFDLFRRKWPHLSSGRCSVLYITSNMVVMMPLIVLV